MNYKKIYESLIRRALEEERCFDKTAHERHHILPRSMGGGDTIDNLVIFTFREHYIAHKLLYKIHKGSSYEYSAHKALYMMSFGKNKNRPKANLSSREFERIKRQDKEYQYILRKWHKAMPKEYLPLFSIELITLPKTLANAYKTLWAYQKPTNERYSILLSTHYACQYNFRGLCGFAGGKINKIGSNCSFLTKDKISRNKAGFSIQCSYDLFPVEPFYNILSRYLVKDLPNTAMYRKTIRGYIKRKLTDGKNELVWIEYDKNSKKVRLLPYNNWVEPFTENFYKMSKWYTLKDIAIKIESGYFD